MVACKPWLPSSPRLPRALPGSPGPHGQTDTSALWRRRGSLSRTSWCRQRSKEGLPRGVGGSPPLGERTNSAIHVSRGFSVGRAVQGSPGHYVMSSGHLGGRGRGTVAGGGVTGAGVPGGKTQDQGMIKGLWRGGARGPWAMAGGARGQGAMACITLWRPRHPIWGGVHLL